MVSESGSPSMAIGWNAGRAGRIGSRGQACHEAGFQ
jgi:hypothetical protein